MPTTAAEIRATVEQRFAQVARQPGQEKKFPVGPASAKKLGYEPQEIDVEEKVHGWTGYCTSSYTPRRPLRPRSPGRTIRPRSNDDDHDVHAFQRSVEGGSAAG
jgi:hypothetical protein